MNERHLVIPDDHFVVSRQESDGLPKNFPLLRLPSELRNAIYEFFVASYMETAVYSLAEPGTILYVYPDKLAELLQCFTVCQEFSSEIGRILLREYIPKITLVFHFRNQFFCFLNSIGTRYPDFSAELHLQSGVNLTQVSRPVKTELDQGIRIVRVIEGLEGHPGADFSESDPFGMPSGPVTVRDGAWEVKITWYISQPERPGREWLRRHAISLKGHLGHFDLVRKL
jgi:hypothetical protein